MNYMLVKLGKELIMLNLNEIDWVKSEGKYLRIHKGEKSYLKRQSLNSFEDYLDTDRFVRVNRSAIVNINRIKKIERNDKYNYFILLHNNQTLSWSRSYRRKLLDIMMA
ncbi:MAG: LytTR family transcriptional regulator [Candidatus Aminicenantes bacterium]|nr:LytTR family transcriptional regulator [Candidatus Aminicenantes bacterium]